MATMFIFHVNILNRVLLRVMEGIFVNHACYFMNCATHF